MGHRRYHRPREEITRIFNRLNRLERRTLRLGANLLFLFRVVAWPPSPGLSNLWCPLEYTLLPYSAGLKAKYWQLSQWFGRRLCIVRARGHRQCISWKHPSVLKCMLHQMIHFAQPTGSSTMRVSDLDLGT